jgi:protocatechuate 3,4-dioxygenase beta subunit
MTIVALLGALLLLQQPVAETASITGRVFDEATGQPIPRALVMVTDSQSEHLRRTTGEDGRFSFDGLVAGTYFVSASAGEFRATYVSSAERLGRYQQVRLQPGQRRTVDIALLRALAISGRVVDQSGFPLSHLGVRLRHLETGRQIHAMFSHSTDDQGAFRMFGLAPGRYLVCAITYYSPSFDGRSRQAAERFVDTCYPSAPDESSAHVVHLGSSSVEGLEIRMLRHRMQRISGHVLDANGAAPPSFFLELMKIEPNGAGGSGTRVQGASFRATNVAPGRYAVTARIGPDPSPSSRPEQLGATFVDVGSDDIHNVVVTTRPPVSVHGRITFEEGEPAGFAPGKVRIDPQPSDRGWPSPGVRNVAVGDDLTFTLSQLFGPTVLQISGLPPGTNVKSILYRGRDVLHRATEFSGDPKDLLEIVMTARVGVLGGRVIDTRTQPVEGARVYLFPAGKDRWAGHWIRSAVSSSDGTYRFSNLASGDYLVVAISAQDEREIRAADWFRPYPHERLSTIAEIVHLLDNDRRTLDLRVTPIPQDWKR